MKGPQRGETNTAWGPSGCCPSYSRGNRHPSLPPGPPISIFLCLTPPEAGDWGAWLLQGTGTGRTGGGDPGG